MLGLSEIEVICRLWMMRSFSQNRIHIYSSSIRIIFSGNNKYNIFLIREVNLSHASQKREAVGEFNSYLIYWCCKSVLILNWFHCWIFSRSTRLVLTRIVILSVLIDCNNIWTGDDGVDYFYFTCSEWQARKYKTIMYHSLSTSFDRGWSKVKYASVVKWWVTWNNLLTSQHLWEDILFRCSTRLCIS